MEQPRFSGAENRAGNGAFLLINQGKTRQENNFLRSGVRSVDTRAISGYNFAV